MSGFSDEWLALREPADQAARHPELLQALAAALAGHSEVSVVDLGCGTGSNLRALAPRLPASQHWRLIDHDPALLRAARDRLAAWATRAAPEGEGLRVSMDGRELRIDFVEADLAAGLDMALGDRPDLVAAAALFDLVSPDWIAHFATAVAARGAIFYTALVYDGSEQWQPPHPGDGAIHAAFHAHQKGDKGFGPAAGPAAAAALASAFAAQGYDIRIAPSPWRLGPESATLIARIAQGYADAARETGTVPEAAIADWLAARLSEAHSLTLGHTDLLAFPPPTLSAGL